MANQLGPVSEQDTLVAEPYRIRRAQGITHQLNLQQRALDLLILDTPTSAFRNKLTDINIHILLALEEAKKVNLL